MNIKLFIFHLLNSSITNSFESSISSYFGVTIIFWPLVSYICISFIGRKIGQLGVTYFTLYTQALLTVIGCKYILGIIIKNDNDYVHLGLWFKIDYLSVYWDFIFDNLCLTILLIIILVVLCVNLFSFAYIWSDPHFNRFISYLALFTFFIIFLVSSGNLVIFFIGWEGVGLCSYLLINFWSTRLQANKAAIKAIIINKIGDITLLIGICLTSCVFYSIDFTVLNAFVAFIFDNINNSDLVAPLDSYFIGPLYNKGSKDNYFELQKILDIICILFFVSVCAKSAQFGLHTWLPSAIEGPTPVSALIHAATIVTAGVFLILRLPILFHYSYFALKCLIVIGLITIITASSSAITQFDVKKIIAYSTCSQLGYITLACGIEEFAIAYFHLINHAFFKALLFLAAGTIIHFYNGEQDIRKIYIGLSSPLVFVTFTIGSLALIGLPFYSGFYSKELIILAFSSDLSGYFYRFFVYCIIIIPTLLTVIYSARLFFFLFINKQDVVIGANKQDIFINYALGLLLTFSIIVGYISSEFLIGPVSIFTIWELNGGYTTTITPFLESTEIANSSADNYVYVSEANFIESGYYGLTVPNITFNYISIPRHCFITHLNLEEAVGIKNFIGTVLPHYDYDTNINFEDIHHMDKLILEFEIGKIKIISVHELYEKNLDIEINLSLYLEAHEHFIRSSKESTGIITDNNHLLKIIENNKSGKKIQIYNPAYLLELITNKIYYFDNIISSIWNWPELKNYEWLLYADVIFNSTQDKFGTIHEIINNAYGINSFTNLTFDLDNITTIPYTIEKGNMYSILISIFHINYTVIIQKIILIYYPLFNNYCVGTTPVVGEWIDLITKASINADNFEELLFNESSLFNIILFHMRYYKEFFGSQNELNFIRILISESFLTKTNYSLAGFSYTGIKNCLQYSATVNTINVYQYYALIWKLGVVIEKGSWVGSPIWLIWLVKLHSFLWDKEGLLSSHLLTTGDLINPSFITQLQYSYNIFYITTINFYNGREKMLFALNYWSNYIGSSLELYITKRINNLNNPNEVFGLTGTEIPVKYENIEGASIFYTNEPSPKFYTMSIIEYHLITSLLLNKDITNSNYDNSITYNTGVWKWYNWDMYMLPSLVVETYTIPFSHVQTIYQYSEVTSINWILLRAIAYDHIVYHNYLVNPTQPNNGIWTILGSKLFSPFSVIKYYWLDSFFDDIHIDSVSDLSYINDINSASFEAIQSTFGKPSYIYLPNFIAPADNILLTGVKIKPHIDTASNLVLLIPTEHYGYSYIKYLFIFIFLAIFIFLVHTWKIIHAAEINNNYYTMLVNQYNSNKFNASYYTAQAYVINKVSIVHHKLSYLYIFWLANNNFIIDQIYAYHASLVLKICNIIYNLFDKGVLEKFGPTGLDKLIIYISKKYKKFTNKNFSIVNIIITFYLIMFFVILFIAVIL